MSWTARISAALALATGSAAAAGATAAIGHPVPWQLNMTEGASPLSHQVYDLHMYAFWVCVGIGVVVFGAMIIAMVRFRKSRGAVAETWTHNAKLEVIWTVVPVLILIALALPATRILINESNTGDAGLTVKVTGFQWKWRYDYVDYQGRPVSRVGFISKLAFNSDEARQLDSGINPRSIKSKTGYDDYLLNVNHPLVVPTHTKIRFVITADDVIHGWWVPALGWQADAVPGLIHDTWGEIDTPGTYRGQCAQLCGQDHAYMPIVIKAVPPDAFQGWLAAQESRARLDTAARTVQVAPVPAPAPQG